MKPALTYLSILAGCLLAWAAVILIIHTLITL